MSVPFYSRALQKKLSEVSKGKQKIKLVFGPRQSGKSTLLHHRIVNSGNTMEIPILSRLYENEHRSDHPAINCRAISCRPAGTSPVGTVGNSLGF